MGEQYERKTTQDEIQIFIQVGGQSTKSAQKELQRHTLKYQATHVFFAQPLQSIISTKKTLRITLVHVIHVSSCTLDSIMVCINRLF